MGTPADRTPQERNASRLLAHELWSAVDEDRECERPDDEQTFGLACEVRDLEAELSIEQAETCRMRTRIAELHQAMLRVANDTPYPDEANDALAQRGAMVAEVGTLKARVAELEAELEDLRHDFAECQSILDHMDTVAV